MKLGKLPAKSNTKSIDRRFAGLDSKVYHEIKDAKLAHGRTTATEERITMVSPVEKHGLTRNDISSIRNGSITLEKFLHYASLRAQAKSANNRASCSETANTTLTTAENE